MTAKTMREIFAELIDKWRLEGFPEPASDLQAIYVEFYGERKESKGAPPPNADDDAPKRPRTRRATRVSKDEKAVHEDTVDVPEDNSEVCGTTGGEA